MKMIAGSSSVLTAAAVTSSWSTVAAASVPFRAKAPQLYRHEIRISAEAQNEKTFLARGTGGSDGPKQPSSSTIKRAPQQQKQNSKGTQNSTVWEPVKEEESEQLHEQEEEAVLSLSLSPSPELQNAEQPSNGTAAPLQHPFNDVEVGKRWREIQGSQEWHGLLEPTIDPVLRSELIRYGEFAQAAYDAFDNDLHSKYCGSCRYSKRHLLEKVELENRGYEVTHYIHSTASGPVLKTLDRPMVKDDEKWSKDSNWTGFVAVAVSPWEIARLGRRDIMVVWRGTVTKSEWREHLQNVFIPRGLDPQLGNQGRQDLQHHHHLGMSKQIKVEDTFLDIYRTKNPDSRYNKSSAQEQALAAVEELLEKYGDEKDLSITVTGHSMGGALATLCAYDLAASGTNRRAKDLNSDGDGGERVPITVYSFAAPRAGNNAFRDRVMELGVKALRVVNVNDFIPYTPGLIFNENLEFLHAHNFSRNKNKLLKLVYDFLELLPITYAHVGVELELDHSHSPFLKQGTFDRMNVHNLEVYLHLLDGYVAKGAPFAPSGRRHIALVNRTSNFLQPQYCVPEFWWQVKNKGLVRDGGGHWVVPEREEEDIPQKP